MSSGESTPRRRRPSSRERPTAHVSTDPPRNFTLSTDERIRALTIGAPAYALRKRKIEDMEEEMVESLVDLHDQIVGKGASAAQLASAIDAKARSFNLERLNELVTQHNRYYPAEANLRIDPSTGGYLVRGRPWEPEPEWTVERLLARLDERLRP